MCLSKKKNSIKIQNINDLEDFSPNEIQYLMERCGTMRDFVILYEKLNRIDSFDEFLDQSSGYDLLRAVSFSVYSLYRSFFQKNNRENVNNLRFCFDISFFDLSLEDKKLHNVIRDKGTQLVAHSDLSADILLNHQLERNKRVMSNKTLGKPLEINEIAYLKNFCDILYNKLHNIIS